MKFTFLIPKRVAYIELVDWELQKFIADGQKWDYIFVENKDEHERLANLKQIGYPVFEAEKVTKNKVEKEEKKKKEVAQEESKIIVEVKEAETLEELHEIYMKTFDKDKVPANKKNDEEWLRNKILEA